MCDSYPVFESDCHSLLKKYLTQDVYNRLKNRATAFGFTLDQAIASGVANQDSHIGVYAGDAESYSLFSELFDSIIKEYHGVAKEEVHKSDLNTSSLELLNPDPEEDYILSTRIRVGRNLADFPLGPAVSDAQRHAIAERVVAALQSLEGDLSGTYYAIDGMAENDRLRLIEDHFLFKAGDRFLDAAGLNRNWPHDRGIFHNRDKTFLVWVNEEDQMRIISMEQGGSILSVFERLVRAVKAMAMTLDFLYDARLGYLTSCPTNLGTAMRASVHIRLPHLAQDLDQLHATAEAYQLQVRGIHGEHSESVGGVFDISNRRRLGISEVDCVRDLHRGVEALIEKERSLQ